MAGAQRWLKGLIPIWDFQQTGSLPSHLGEVAPISNGPPGAQGGGAQTTANIPPSPMSVMMSMKQKSLGWLIFEGIGRDLAERQDHLGARLHGGQGALPAAAHAVEPLRKVFAELLGEETVDDGV